MSQVYTPDMPPPVKFASIKTCKNNLWSNRKVQASSDDLAGAPPQIPGARGVSQLPGYGYDRRRQHLVRGVKRFRSVVQGLTSSWLHGAAYGRGASPGLSACHGCVTGRCCQLGCHGIAPQRAAIPDHNWPQRFFMQVCPPMLTATD